MKISPYPRIGIFPSLVGPCSFLFHPLSFAHTSSSLVVPLPYLFTLSILHTPSPSNMDDITSKWNRLSLNQTENQTIVLIPTVTGNGKVLVAKFFTKRRINMEAVLRTLKSMWKTEKSFDVRDLGSNMALVLFDEEYDLDHILMRGP